MLRALLRLFLALSGGALAAVLVAFVEARVVSGAVGATDGAEASFGSLFANDLGLLAPVIVGVAIGAGILALLVLPDDAMIPLRWLARLRGAADSERSRVAAIAPLVVLSTFGWCLASAHLARVAMGGGKPAEAGLSIGVESVAALVAFGTIGLACLPFVQRVILHRSASVPQLLDPAFTSSIAFALVALVFGLGIALGDTSGAGGGLLGIFGVLKRTELDLRPVAELGVIGLGALAMFFVRLRLPESGEAPRPDARLAAGLAGIVVFLVSAGLCVHASSGLAEVPNVAQGIEKNAPLGKIALAVLRRASDHDKDGFSATYGGGDCNDHDPHVNPNAIDVPGNGVDEDCSGADTPAAVEEHEDAASAHVTPKPKRTFNVILLTVDTLRPDLGFMNYDKPTSPNLDKIAEKATIFERAYSMASYTGKAVGPMLIGKYPSETLTDFSHFNTYFESNVFVAERLRDAGVRTFAGMCHWYFRNPTGLKQGFEVWDTSAIPPGMGDNDNVVTSDRMADLALKLLQRPENTLGAANEDPAADSDAGDADKKPSTHRFFAWFHFFDPHAQYVPHEGSPDFNGKGPVGSQRAIYDQEVWYTDKHIGRVLDYVASQPWAEDTAIVMTADHGEAFYEHNMMRHGSEIWDELVHVPLFVYVPGAEPRRVSARRSHIDVVPTILELMGVPLPEDDSLRGKSLVDDVYLPKDGQHEERDIYIDMPQGPFNGVKRAVITVPGLKLIHSGGAMYQLFDLESDPDEKKDLANNKELRATALERMNAIRSRLKEIEVKPPQ
jgi:arylsulfatase A-like enzyme